jgi:DNA-binding transcriptional MerR regulator
MSDTGDGAMTVLKRDEDVDTRPYRSISEVAELVGVQAHVLRYWETQFSGLRPRKNRAGNRMYRPEDVRMLLHIKELLYARRFTIEGAKRTLSEERKDPPQVELGFGEAVHRVVIHEVKSELRRLAVQLRRGETTPAS